MEREREREKGREKRKIHVAIAYLAVEKSSATSTTEENSWPHYLSWYHFYKEKLNYELFFM